MTPAREQVSMLPSAAAVENCGGSGLLRVIGDDDRDSERCACFRAPPRIVAAEKEPGT